MSLSIAIIEISLLIFLTSFLSFPFFLSQFLCSPSSPLQQYFFCFFIYSILPVFDSPPAITLTYKGNFIFLPRFLLFAVFPDKPSLFRTKFPPFIPLVVAFLLFTTSIALISMYLSFFFVFLPVLFPFCFFFGGGHHYLFQFTLYCSLSYIHSIRDCFSSFHCQH